MILKIDFGLTSIYNRIPIQASTMTADLKTWLEEVSADAGTDVTGHLDSLTSHGAFYTSCGVLTRVLHH